MSEAEINGGLPAVEAGEQQQQRSSSPKPVNGNAEKAEGASALRTSADWLPSNESNRPKLAKTVFFHRDGIQYKQPVRVAIHPNRYRGFESLLTELTHRMPELSYGVRAVYTPKGRDRLNSLTEFDNRGHYVCATTKRRPVPVDPSRQQQQQQEAPAWRAVGGGRNNTAPEDLPPLRQRLPQRRQQQLSGASEPTAAAAANGEAGDSPYRPVYRPADCKRILVSKNGEPFKKHIVLLNKRMVKSFEQVMDDLSGIFQMQVRKVYSEDGQLVESLSAIYNGPERYIVGGLEKFRPLVAWGPDVSPTAKQRSSGAPQAPIGRRKERKGRNAAVAAKQSWRVKVTTASDSPASGTSSHVFLTVYGSQGNSGQLQLVMPVASDGMVNPFLPGSEDEFEVSFSAIGQVTKIRLETDSSGSDPAWSVGSLQLIGNGESLLFEFNRWLAEDKGDGEIVCELPAVRDGVPALPIEVYKIEVYTADFYNAGTAGSVSVILLGDKGDSGKRRLRRSDGQSAFQKGQVDRFELQCVSVGQLSKIEIGHDAKGPGFGWFLEKVVVLDSSGPVEGSVFACNRWLDEGEDDGKLWRELKLHDDFMQDYIEQEVWECIAWQFNSGNELQLYSKVTEKALRINEDGSVDANAGENDSLSLLQVQARKGNVRLFRSAASPKLHLAIDDGKITGLGKGGALCELKVRPQPDRSVLLESVKQPLQQVNIGQDGDVLDPRQWRGSATAPGKLFVPYCRGTLRHNGIVQFCTSLTQTLAVDHDSSLHGTGKRGRMAQFKVQRVEGEAGVRLFESVMFPEQFLRIRDGVCDCAGTGDIHSYFKVEKYKDKGFVTLECLGAKGSFVGLSDDGKVIAVEDKGQQNVRLYPEVVQFGQPKPQEQKEQNEQVPVVASELATAGTVAESLAKEEEEETEAEAELPAAADTARSELPDLAAEEWLLLLETEATCQNGRVTVFAQSASGSAGPVQVAESGSGLLAEGSEDAFKVTLSGIGQQQLQVLRLQLEPLGEGECSWTLARVCLLRPEAEYTFAEFSGCSLGRSVGAIDIGSLELPLQPLRLLQYRVQLRTASEQQQPFAAGLFVRLVGEERDSGCRWLWPSEPLAAGDSRDFTLSAADLGRITGCQLGIDQAADLGWRCESVSVAVLDGDQLLDSVQFECSDWLGDGAVDGKREMMLSRDVDLAPIQNSSTDINLSAGDGGDNDNVNHQEASFGLVGIEDVGDVVENNEVRDNNETENNDAENNDAENNDAENNDAENNDAENNDAENNDAENNEAENNEAENNGAENNEAENNEAENNEVENNDAENNDAENNDAENNEADNNEAVNSEAENNEAEKNGAENNETENNEVENSETENNEAESNDADNIQPENNEAENNEAENNEAENNEAENHEVTENAVENGESQEEKQPNEQAPAEEDDREEELQNITEDAKSLMNGITDQVAKRMENLIEDDDLQAGNSATGNE